MIISRLERKTFCISFCPADGITPDINFFFFLVIPDETLVFISVIGSIIKRQCGFFFFCFRTAFDKNNIEEFL